MFVFFPPWSLRSCRGLLASLLAPSLNLSSAFCQILWLFSIIFDHMICFVHCFWYSQRLAVVHKYWHLLRFVGVAFGKIKSILWVYWWRISFWWDLDPFFVLIFPLFHYLNSLFFCEISLHLHRFIVRTSFFCLFFIRADDWIWKHVLFSW